MPALTGDLFGKLALLQRALAQIRYPLLLDVDAIKQGQHQALLPVISYVLRHYSRHIAALCFKHEICGKGKRYIESVFRLSREEFNLKIELSSAQFLAQGYAERKLMFVHQFIMACREYHSAAVRKERLTTIKEKKSRQKMPKDYHEIHEEKLEDDGESTTAVKKLSKTTSQQRNKTPPDQPRSLPTLLAFTSMDESSVEAFAVDMTRPATTPEQPSYYDLGFLIQDVKDLDSRFRGIETTMKQVQHISNTSSNIQTSLAAHLKVLEGRVTVLEKGKGCATRGVYPELDRCTGYMKSYKPMDEVSQSGEAFINANTKHTTPPSASAAAGPFEKLQEQQGIQQWFRWNSPTTSFNPLYTHQFTPGSIHKIHQQQEGREVFEPSGTAEKDCAPHINSDIAQVLASLQSRLKEAAVVLHEARNASVM